MLKRFVLLLGACLILALVVGCGSASITADAPAGSVTSSGSGTVAPTASATTEPMPSDASSTPSGPTTEEDVTPQTETAQSQAATNLAQITGFGATGADWERVHTPDPRIRAGNSYDQQPDGTEKFWMVGHNNGRVTSFLRSYPGHGASASTAKDDMRAMLPPDAKVIYGAIWDTCEVIRYQSATLASVLGDPTKVDDPGGLVDAVLFNSNTPKSYDPQSIDTVSVARGWGDLSTGRC